MRIEIRRCGYRDDPTDPAAGVPIPVVHSKDVLDFLWGKSVFATGGLGGDAVSIQFQDNSSLWVVARGGHVRVVLRDPPS